MQNIMASQSPMISSGRIPINRQHDVTPQEEDWQMIRYTKLFTRELVFAVDLTTFVMKLSGIHFRNFIFPNCFGKRGPSDFDDKMSKFVEQMLVQEVKAIAAKSMEDQMVQGRISYEKFKNLVNASALRTENFPYVEFNYLMFCITTAEMATIAYRSGLQKAPDFGIMIMCRTYSNFYYKSAMPRIRGRVSIVQHLIYCGCWIFNNGMVSTALGASLVLLRSTSMSSPSFRTRIFSLSSF